MDLNKLLARAMPTGCPACKGNGLVTVDAGESLPLVCICSQCNGSGHAEEGANASRYYVRPLYGAMGLERAQLWPFKWE